jgi:hypothetical protein
MAADVISDSLTWSDEKKQRALELALQDFFDLDSEMEDELADTSDSSWMD